MSLAEERSKLACVHNAHASTCLGQVVEVARTVSIERRPGEPTPAAYYRDLLADDASRRTEAIRSEIAYLRDVFAFADLDDLATLEILEVGSGFGIGVMATACLGAPRVCGVELVSWQVDWAERCLAALDANLADRVSFARGNATELPYESSRFDVVLALEAMSHYLDYKPFLAEAWRVLRPHGVLIISDGNNGLNPLIRRRTTAIWASHEQPPGGARRGPRDYPFYFVDKRQELVEHAYPALPPETTLALALRTAGMTRDEVLTAARAYVEDGVMPDQPYRRGQLSVHPTHEMVMERLFNPFRLAREIEEYGFHTKTKGHWAGATKRRSLRFANTVLAAITPVSIVTARGFRIAARKPSA